MSVIAQDALASRANRDEGVRAEAGTIAAMDGLRGVSVLWIVLFHYSVLRDAAPDPWAALLREAPVLSGFIAHGPCAVDLFFVISGFLLTLPWIARHRDGTPAPDTKRFYVRRIRRIVPAYYVHLAALFAVVMPLLHGIAWWRSDLYVDALNAVAHGLFVQNLSPLTSASLGANGALWTLAVEAQFYALLPLLAPLFVRAPWRSLAASMLLSAAWIAAARHGFDAIVRWHLEIGRAWHWDEGSIRTLLSMQLPAYLADFGLGAAMGRLWLLHRPSLARYRPMLLGPASLLERGPLAFMGRISYSAYLWHLPLLLCLQARAPLETASLFPAYLAAVVAIGWLSWRVVERPFMQRGERASAGPPPSP